MNNTLETTPPVLIGFSSSVLIPASQLGMIKKANEIETGVAIAFLPRPLINADVSYELLGEQTVVRFGTNNEEILLSKEAFNVVKGVEPGKLMIRLERPEAASTKGQQAKFRVISNHPIFGYQVEEKSISIEFFNYLLTQSVQLTALAYQTGLAIQLSGKVETVKGEILALPINLKPEIAAFEGEQMNLIVVNVSIPRQIEDEVLRLSESAQTQLRDQLAQVLGVDTADLVLQTETEGVELEAIARNGFAEIEAKYAQHTFARA